MLNEEIIRKESKKYSSKKEFETNNRSFYRWALRHKIIDDLFENKRRILNEEIVRKEAKKYSTKKEFEINDASCYCWSLDNKIIDDLFENQLRTLNEKVVRKEAKKYSSKKEFETNDSSCYQWARKNNLLNKLFKNKLRSLNEELVRKEAKKYTTRSEFSRKDTSCYNYALKNNLLKELFPIKINNFRNKKFIVYKYILSDNNNNEYIYIGITCDEYRRKMQHYNKTTYSAIKEKIDEGCVEVSYEILHENLSYNDAREIEVSLIEKKLNDISLLNKKR